MKAPFPRVPTSPPGWCSLYGASHLPASSSLVADLKPASQLKTTASCLPSSHLFIPFILVHGDLRILFLPFYLGSPVNVTNTSSLTSLRNSEHANLEPSPGMRSSWPGWKWCVNHPSWSRISCSSARNITFWIISMFMFCYLAIRIMWEISVKCNSKSSNLLIENSTKRGNYVKRRCETCSLYYSWWTHGGSWETGSMDSFRDERRNLRSQYYGGSNSNLTGLLRTGPSHCPSSGTPHLPSVCTAVFNPDILLISDDADRMRIKQLSRCLLQPATSALLQKLALCSSTCPD